MIIDKLQNLICKNANIKKIIIENRHVEIVIYFCYTSILVLCTFINSEKCRRTQLLYSTILTIYESVIANINCMVL